MKGFHSYPWGTRFTDIPELEGSFPVAESEGLAAFTADVEFLGEEALAAFYFHPRTGGLVEGYYVLPVALDGCEQKWERYAGSLAEAYPGLVVEEKRPIRPDVDRGRYDSDCEYFVYNSENAEWSSAFVNPDPPRDRAGIWMKTVGRSLHLTLFYRGGDGTAWQEGPKRTPRRSIFPSEPPPATPAPVPPRAPPPPALGRG